MTEQCWWVGEGEGHFIFILPPFSMEVNADSLKRFDLKSSSHLWKGRKFVPKGNNQALKSRKYSLFIRGTYFILSSELMENIIVIKT